MDFYGSVSPSAKWASRKQLSRVPFNSTVSSLMGSSMGWVFIHVLGWPKSSFRSIRCYRKTHTNFLTKLNILRFLMRIYLYNAPFKKKKKKKTLLLFLYSIIFRNKELGWHLIIWCIREELISLIHYLLLLTPHFVPRSLPPPPQRKVTLRSNPEMLGK